VTDSQLLDVWCALNASVGGPLLALVTIGGVIATGRSLQSFPERKTDETIGTVVRRKYNRFRCRILLSGIATLILLFVNVCAYVYAFGSIRLLDKACVAPPLTETSRFALAWFFGVTLLTAVVGSTYSFCLNILKRL
jgi:hypothetical protein